MIYRSPQGHVNTISLDGSNIYIGQAKSTNKQGYAMQWDGTTWKSVGPIGSLPGDILVEGLLPQLSIN